MRPGCIAADAPRKLEGIRKFSPDYQPRGRSPTPPAITVRVHASSVTAIGQFTCSAYDLSATTPRRRWMAVSWYHGQNPVPNILAPLPVRNHCLAFFGCLQRLRTMRASLYTTRLRRFARSYCLALRPRQAVRHQQLPITESLRHFSRTRSLKLASRSAVRHTIS